MKKVKNPLRHVVRKVRRTKEPAQPSRITNETVAEHREQILAGGRKFKYPVQYARHRLVINSIIIGVVAIVTVAVLIWWQLYPEQNASSLAYRVTQLLPLPVAKVDGQPVLYRNYLLKFRSSLHFLEQQNAITVESTDGKRQVNFIKRQELNNVIYDAYVAKLAREKHITVSSKDVDSFINDQLAKQNISLSDYETTVLQKYYDWSLGEYKTIVHNDLLKRKVAFAIDTAAKTKAEAAFAQIKTGADFATTAAQVSDDAATKANGGNVGTIPVKNQDPNGLIATAQALKVGETSALLQGTDAYYIIKLVDKTDTTVQYQQIKISLTQLDTQFNGVKQAHEIHEYISVAQ